ncbi:PH domain-containing protein [Terrabacter sp. 2RAF25]|uniref:PH domain-containing protein n=1 Tax=Terrabacter sp. 2RAF25 TaxID=3232998 RepID=UPI003F9D1FC6
MTDQPAASREPTAAADPLAPFRPRRGRAVALGVACTSLVVFGAIAVVMPTQADGRWGVGDRVMFFALGAALAFVAWRYASIVAVPSRDGLVVRNLVLTRTLDWAEVVRVQFGGGEPWVSLDLEDGDTVAVMAIQKADGDVSGREASRLAALVQAFGETPEPGGPGGQGGRHDPADPAGPADPDHSEDDS